MGMGVIREKYNDHFLKALARLNESQRKAVEAIEGPVLVIAGPGTGKTQILAARIGKILLDTDTQPHHILCLTYTDAGAVAMRKRLFDFIGPEAYRVHIYTFHAFCNDIIQENLDYFGKLELEAISDLERMSVLRQLIDQFEVNHPLKRYHGDVYYEIGRLQQLFSVMKREDWSPEYIDKKIDEFINLIRECDADSVYYKEYKYTKKYRDREVGSLKPAFITLKDRLEKLRAAAYEFPKYQQMMREMGRYDYDDMILWILHAFKTDEQFLLNYQERYLYVLVDEYQDTSGSQNELVQLLMNYWDQPNIFVVGDDDQSIFRFQGANVQNMEEYHARYAHDLCRVMLTDNYRSTQPILDVAKVLIDHNTERIHLPGLSKTLFAQNETNLPIQPEIRAYPTPFYEFAAITDEISRQIAQGILPQDIAVIYKEHRSGEALAHYFQLKGIPIQTKRKVNILKDPFGQKLITLLRYLALESQSPYTGDPLLFEIMHYDFYHIASIDIAKLSVEVNAYNYQHKEKTSIRARICELAAQTQSSLFDTESHQQIKLLSQHLEYWIKGAYNWTIQNLFERMIGEGGILAYILKSPDKTWLMQVLTSLFSFLKEESGKKPDLKLKEFVLLLDLLQENDLSLELNQYIFNQQGVNFLTCHGSKGLEFDYVYLIGATKNVWEKKRKNQSGYQMPDTVFSSLPHASEEEELRRLFYVALTRAKKQVWISFAQQNEQGKVLEPTVFIGEILAGTDLQIQDQQIAESVLSYFFALQFSATESPSLGLIDEQYVSSLLEGYVLNLTHLNNYLDCPLKFYFQNLIRVPKGKNDTLTFGSAVHSALHKLFLSLKNNDNQFHSLKHFMDDFYWYMRRNREAFTAEQFKRRMEYGDQILPAYYQHYIHTWEKAVLTEYTIKNVEVDGVPIKGVLDKIEFKGKDVNVVDYKTGSYAKAKAKFKRPDEMDSLGGDYWRQAVFYKLLVDHDRTTTWQVVSAEFDFVESEEGNYFKEKMVITPEDLTLVKAQIKNTYSRIMNHEFTVGCGKAECIWCTFVSANFTE